MRLTLSSYSKHLTFAVILIGLVTISCGLTNHVYADSLNLPIVQQPFQHEAYQFGYDPNYMINVPTFDSLNRPYIRSRAGDVTASATTGYIQTLRDGQWVQLDFMPAVMDKYWDFEEFVKYNGYGGGRIVFDADDDMYTWVIVKRESGYVTALIYSSDYGETFQVYGLPGGTYDIEHWVGHNTLNRPPLLCRFSTPTTNDPNVTIDVLQPIKEVGGLTFGSLANVTNKGLYLTRHAGHPSFAVSTEEGVFDKTFITWVETADGIGTGSPTYVAEYDTTANTVNNKTLVAYSQAANDSHNTPGIAIDSQGYLHVITGSEQYHFLYTRSLQPYSVTDGFTTPVYTYDKGWDDGSGEEGKMAYLSMLIDLNDNIHLIFRNWRRGVDSYHSGGVIAALAYQTKTAQGSWPQDAQLMVIPPFTGYSNYYQKLEMDKLGNLFLFYEYLESETGVYAYPENPVDDYYPAMIMSNDSGQNWRLAGDGDFETNACPVNYLKMDLNTDCYVDLLDFAMLADSWRKCNKADDPNCWMD